MSERWREKANIIAVEHGDTVSQLGDRKTLDVDMTIDEKTFQRMREGYLCMVCTEPHERPFPEHCAVCNFEMRKYQAEQMEREYAGQKWIGPTISDQDEISLLEELSARRRWEKGL